MPVIVFVSKMPIIMGTLVGTKEEMRVGHGIISPVSGWTDEPIIILLRRYS